MKFTETYTLTSHDVDYSMRARPSAILRLMQECANHSMRDEGESYIHLFERGLAFVLAEIYVKQFVSLRQYDSLDVSTWASSDSHGVSFDRCYTIYRGQTLAVQATSVWAVIDRRGGTKRLMRVGEENFTYSADAPLEAVTHFRIPRDAVLQPCGNFCVSYRDADVNRHMNNTYYPDELLGFTEQAGGREISSYAIRFVSEAPLGETVDVSCASDGESCIFRTNRRSDNAVNVEAKFVFA